MTTNRMGLTPEQAANCFSDDELEMMQHDNNPRSHAFRELLAYRKASKEVAGYLYEGDGVEWPSISLPDELDEQQIANCTPLYAAPPLQAVTVPDEISPSRIQEMAMFDGVELDDDEANTAADGWNACRAVMLKSVTNEP